MAITPDCAGLYSSKIERRAATSEDLETLYGITVRAMKDHVIENYGAWHEEVQRESFRETTQVEAHELLLDKSRPVGFLNVFRSESGIYLNRICILPEYQGRGIGTGLIRELIASCTPDRPLRLQVFPGNPALNLYRRLGFRETKRTPTHIHMVYASGSE